MQYGMVIDTRRCIGCHTCAVACKTANNLPDGIWWNRVLTEGGASMDSAGGMFPDTKLRFMPISCQHCANPACVKVCPVGATYKDEATGIVRQDYDKCIGCRMCIAACPYTGVRSYNWEEPKYTAVAMMGDPDVPKHQKHTVEKCTFCFQRIKRGDAPACMTPCPVRARYFGDLDDEKSEVSRLVATRSYAQLLPEKGTKPSVYYLI